MTILFRFLILVSTCLVGEILAVFSIHMLIAGGAIPEGLEADNFGSPLTLKTVYIWIAASLIGLISLFVESKGIRIAIVTIPLIAPALFVIAFTLLQ